MSEFRKAVTGMAFYEGACTNSKDESWTPDLRSTFAKCAHKDWSPQTPYYWHRDTLGFTSKQEQEPNMEVTLRKNGDTRYTPAGCWSGTSGQTQCFATFRCPQCQNMRTLGIAQAPDGKRHTVSPAGRVSPGFVCQHPIEGGSGKCLFYAHLILEGWTGGKA